MVAYCRPPIEAKSPPQARKVRERICTSVMVAFAVWPRASLTQARISMSGMVMVAAAAGRGWVISPRVRAAAVRSYDCR